jgi:endonuclease YncB( thermonuclease family)
VTPHEKLREAFEELWDMTAHHVHESKHDAYKWFLAGACKALEMADGRSKPLVVGPVSDEDRAKIVQARDGDTFHWGGEPASIDFRDPPGGEGG